MQNKALESRGWRCIELEDGSRHLHFSSPSVGLGDVGELIEYDRGGEIHRGTLVATSEMGVTSIDLFNDILVCEEDLGVLLKNQGISPLPSKAGLLIQAYLVFAREAQVDVFDPINIYPKSDQPLEETIIIDNTESICFEDHKVETASPVRRAPRRATIQAPEITIDQDTFDSLDDDQNYEPIEDMDDDQEQEYRPPKKSVKERDRKTEKDSRKKAEKTKKPKPTGNDSLTFAEKMVAIRQACIHCGGNPETLSSWDQRSYETTMSKHLFEEHQIKDEIYQEDEYHEKLNENYPENPEKREVDGVKMNKCPKCPAMLKRDIDYRKHLQWHDLLDRSGKLQQGELYPCIHCPAFFESVGSHRTHEDQVHPFIKFKCRACDKSFSTRQNRGQHWSLMHRIDACETCEFCGKIFNNNRQLREHIRSHDESKSCTCELCGKAFKNPYALKKHMRWHQDATIKCEICDDKFVYSDALETHLVRVHNKPRKFTCEFCGTQFIHQKHWRRHLNKHNASPDKVYPTQTIRRGYTKSSNKYWEDKKLYPGLNLLKRNQNKKISPKTNQEIVVATSQSLQQVVNQEQIVHFKNGQPIATTWRTIPVQGGGSPVQVNQVFPVDGQIGPFSVQQNNQ